jgi:hypothetical protein
MLQKESPISNSKIFDSASAIFTSISHLKRFPEIPTADHKF